MKKKYFTIELSIAAALLFIILLSYGATGAKAEQAKKEGEGTATARFVNTAGEETGMATLEEGINGVLIRLSLHDMAPGEHAIHIHETGSCTPSQSNGNEDKKNMFKDAGGHFNPSDKEHGLLIKNGPHAGDLMNIYVGENGFLETELFNDRITLSKTSKNNAASLLDEDGAAFIIHDGTDDYKSQPSGDAGNRIACAVIKAE